MQSKDKVYKIYDKIIDWFDAHRSKDLTMEKRYLDYIISKIPVNSQVLDIGCGTGEPIAKYFIAKNFQLTGIDASSKMIQLCKTRFPQAKWHCQDMRKLKLDTTFDLIIAWHSLFHLPQNEQKSTLSLLASYLKKHSLLVFTTGYEEAEEWSNNGGYDLYQASLSIESYQKILQENGLKILMQKIRDPDCGNATVWIAQKS
ncbi:MAG: class I SAM-dependent methyltransferase [Pseudomonadota bacterium]